MSLILTEQSINSLGTELILVDETVWGSNGDPARNTVDVHVYGVNKTTGGEVEVSVTGNDGDPATDSEFSVAIETDGYYEFTIFHVASGTDVSDMKTVVDGVDAANKAAIPILVFSRSAIKRNQLNLDLMKLQMQQNDDRAHRTDIGQKLEQYNFVNSLLNGALYNWYMSSFMDSQRVIESIKNFEV